MIPFRYQAVMATTPAPSRRRGTRCTSRACSMAVIVPFRAPVDLAPLKAFHEFAALLIRRHQLLPQT